jgi:hypothetical protein
LLFCRKKTCRVFDALQVHKCISNQGSIFRTHRARDVKKGFFWFILLLGSSLASISSVNAVSRTYDWNTYQNTHYTVNVIVENPQFDSQFDVVVQLILISKATNLDYTRTNWLQVLRSSSEKPLEQDSGQQNETTTLRNIGDSLQMVFHFQVSSSQYGIGRGQGFAVSVVYRISIDEMDTIVHSFFNHVGDGVNDPMIIQLSIPLLSPLETIIALVVVAVVILIVVYAVYVEMSSRRLEKKERLRKEAIEKRKEAMLVGNFECPFCHTIYDRKLDKCPTCGAAKKIRD